MIRLRPTWRSCCFTYGMLIILPCIASLASSRYSNNKSLCNQSHLWKWILVQPSSIVSPSRYSGGSSNWCSVTGRGSTRYIPAARRCGNIATSSLLGKKGEVVSDVLDNDSDGKNENNHLSHSVRSTISRRKTLTHVAKAAAMLVSYPFASKDNLAMADVGTLPELKGAPAILQGITVSVADESQQNSMIRFLVEGFLFKVLRQRTVGTVTDTVRTDL